MVKLRRQPLRFYNHQLQLSTLDDGLPSSTARRHGGVLPVRNRSVLIEQRSSDHVRVLPSSESLVIPFGLPSSSRSCKRCCVNSVKRRLLGFTFSIGRKGSAGYKKRAPLVARRNSLLSATTTSLDHPSTRLKDAIHYCPRCRCCRCRRLGCYRLGSSSPSPSHSPQQAKRRVRRARSMDDCEFHGSQL